MPYVPRNHLRQWQFDVLIGICNLQILRTCIYIYAYLSLYSIIYAFLCPSPRCRAQVSLASTCQGEISRFTVPEMYLTGGPSQYLAKLPDDGEEVIFDIELVSVVGIRDIFGSLG